MTRSQKQTTGLVHKTPFFYGWVIVFIGAWGIFLSGPGQTYSVSIFIDVYVDEFGWSRSMISTIYSSATLASGILLIFMGRLIDRVGQRWMAVVAGTMLAVACFFNSFVSLPFMLLIGFFLIRLFGQGLMELIPNTMIPQWFVKKRGRAFAFMELGGFISSAALPIINIWLINQFGWTGAWQVWAIVLLVSFVPLAWLLIRNRPETYGLVPDGFSTSKWTSATKTKSQLHSDSITDNEPVWTLQQALKTKMFWGVLFCIAVPAMANTGMTFHIVSILGEAGITRGPSAFILSMMAVVAFPISFLAGFLLERVPLYKLFAFSFFIETIAVVILIVADSFMMAVLFGLARGIAEGIAILCMAIIIPQYFGRENIGSLKGAGMTSIVIASSLGPLPFGIAFDTFGGYTQILLVMVLFFSVAAVIAWLNRG